MDIGLLVFTALWSLAAFILGRQIYLNRKYFHASSYGRLTCTKCGQQFDLYGMHGHSYSWHEPMKSIHDPNCKCYKLVTVDENSNKYLKETKAEAKQRTNLAKMA
jgi:hypothetical protein